MASSELHQWVLVCVNVWEGTRESAQHATSRRLGYVAQLVHRSPHARAALGERQTDPTVPASVVLMMLLLLVVVAAVVAACRVRISSPAAQTSSQPVSQQVSQ
jgi:hypothetical protein